MCKENIADSLNMTAAGSSMLLPLKQERPLTALKKKIDEMRQTIWNNIPVLTD